MVQLNCLKAVFVFTLHMLSFMVAASNASSGTGNGACVWSGNSYYVLDANSVNRVMDLLNEQAGYVARDVDLFHLPMLRYSVRNEQITDVYYDTDDFELLKNGYELYEKTNNSVSKYVKDRSEIIFRESAGNDSSINEWRYRPKKYKKKLENIDDHLLLGRVKRRERRPLLDKLSGLLKDQNMRRLIPVLKVQHNILSVNIVSMEDVFGKVYLDQAVIKVFGASGVHSSAGAVFYEDAMKSLSGDEKKNIYDSISSLNCKIELNVKNVEKVNHIGYKDYYRVATDIMPIFPFSVKNALMFKLVQAFLLMLIAFLPIYLLRTKDLKLVLRTRTKHNFVFKGDSKCDSKG